MSERCEPADLRAAIVARWVAEVAEHEADYARDRLERVLLRLEARAARRWAAARLGIRRCGTHDRKLAHLARRVWCWGW